MPVGPIHHRRDGKAPAGEVVGQDQAAGLLSRFR
jgi:hypothetical protein